MVSAHRQKCGHLLTNNCVVIYSHGYLLKDKNVVNSSQENVWDKLLKSRRGCLEKLRPRESLKPRDFSKLNPRAKPKDLPSGSPEGEVFQTTPRLLNCLSDFGFLKVQGQTCPRALCEKRSRKPQ